MPNVKTTGKKSSNTLVRDLVNVGIFAALYIVLAFLSSSVGYIPALIVFSTGSIALVTSIPLFLFFSKIERSILCCLIFCGFFGTAMFVMGQGILMLSISLPNNAEPTRASMMKQLSAEENFLPSLFALSAFHD